MVSDRGRVGVSPPRKNITQKGAEVPRPGGYASGAPSPARARITDTAPFPNLGGS